MHTTLLEVMGAFAVAFEGWIVKLLFDLRTDLTVFNTRLSRLEGREGLRGENGG